MMVFGVHRWSLLLLSLRNKWRKLHQEILKLHPPKYVWYDIIRLVGAGPTNPRNKRKQLHKTLDQKKRGLEKKQCFKNA